MSKNLIITAIVAGFFLIFGLVFVSSMISFSNNEIDLKSRFTQKTSERTAFYDKMWKTLSGKSQVAVKVDSSFTRNVNTIMTGRKDSGALMMKLVVESNPNANFTEVSKLYADLSRAIEGERDGFFMQEKMMQGIVLEHTNLISKFPGSFYNVFYGRKPIDYKPITSDRTDEVMRTSKDNDVKVF